MPKWILVPNKIYPTISKPSIRHQSREIANTATVVIFEDTKLIVVGLFNSPTTIRRRVERSRDVSKLWDW